MTFDLVAERNALPPWPPNPEAHLIACYPGTWHYYVEVNGARQEISRERYNEIAAVFAVWTWACRQLGGI